MTKRIYVGNLSYQTTDAKLSELFGAVGQVQSVNLIMEPGTGRSKGFAFVEMTDDTVAQEAINQLNEREVDGRNIKVAEARPKPENSGGMGRSRRDDRGYRGGRSSRW
ncbi:MAG: RNA-binding protein [Chloroflexi bacterium]|nr:RNA-binding protein [Chloroflexota bacterium]